MHRIRKGQFNLANVVARRMACSRYSSSTVRASLPRLASYRTTVGTWRSENSTQAHQLAEILRSVLGLNVEQARRVTNSDDTTESPHSISLVPN